MLCGSCSQEICICLAWKNTPRSMVIYYGPVVYGASLVAQRIKRLPPMWDTRVWSLGWEDPLEKEMVTHSSILAWRIPWAEEPGSLQSTGSQGVGHNQVTSLSSCILIDPIVFWEELEKRCSFIKARDDFALQGTFGKVWKYKCHNL